jgi:acetyltransferase-like isoleucine patch superfamily enzyme
VSCARKIRPGLEPALGLGGDDHEEAPVEDGVTVYAHATVLGGSTVLGEDSVVGGSVLETTSVPPGSRVALRPPETIVRSKADAGDFVI